MSSKKELENNTAKNEHDMHSFEIKPLTSSRYINPYRLAFKHNNMNRVWDGIQSHPSVSCIIYNTDKKCLVLVRQFRPVVYLNQVLEKQDVDNTSRVESLEHLQNLDWSKVSPSEAVTYELCAGICDKNKTLEETIKEEILEECGYQVELNRIQKVRSFRMGVGLIGALHTIFFTEVDESMRVEGQGGGNQHEGEFIELFELHESQVREFLNEDGNVKPPGLLYSLIWFLYERKEFLDRK
jgi:UDP-sugar diphosphatase